MSRADAMGRWFARRGVLIGSRWRVCRWEPIESGRRWERLVATPDEYHTEAAAIVAAAKLNIQTKGKADGKPNQDRVGRQDVVAVARVRGGVAGMR